jgi:hypothetical protein
LNQAYLERAAATAHRIDLPCEQTGFSPPPCDVHIKLLPGSALGDSWTLLAHAAAGKPEMLARWLRPHPGVEGIRVAPGLAPKLLRATLAEIPPAWAMVASHARVHHLDLSPEGHASWFVEGVRAQVWALVKRLEEAPGPPLPAREVRCRPVHAGRSDAPVSRRQFETLATAVALGYYEIPHRIDLRTLATHSGVSLGSASELLRRAEGAVLTHYVDSSLMGWPALADETPAHPFRSMDNLARP